MDPTTWTGLRRIRVSDGKAITHYQNAFHQYVVCFDAHTGDTIWEHAVGSTYEAVGIYPGPRSTPAIVDGRMFYVTPEAVLGCLALDTGQPLWQVDLAADFDGTGTEFGYSASPLVHEGRVIVPVGDEAASVVAFDARTGEVAWTSGSEPASYCTTMPIEVDGRTLLVNYLQNHISIVDAGTGEQLWVKDISIGYDEHAAMPIWSSPLLIFSAPFRAGATAYRLSFDNEAAPSKLSVETAWQSEKMSNDTASSVAIDGLLFGFDLREPQAKAHRPSRGSFRCLDCSTGEVLWSDATIGHATIVAADGKLYLFTDVGELIVGTASRAGFMEIARTQVFENEICWTPPALSEGRIYLRSASRAVCLMVGDAEDVSASDIAALPTTNDIPRATRFAFEWLLGGEREHPFMIAPVEDVRRWFLASLLSVVLPAVALASCFFRSTPLGRLRVFAAACFVFGLAAMPIWNSLSDRFWFLLPCVVFAVLAAAVGEAEQVRTQPESRPARRRSRLTGLFLCTVAGGYFWILRDQSLPHEWVYLLGLLPGVLAGAVMSRSLTRSGWSFASVAMLIVAFAIFFWSGPMFQYLRRAIRGGVLFE